MDGQSQLLINLMEESMHHLASMKPFVRSFKLKLNRQHVMANCLLHLHVFSLSHCLPAIHLARHKWKVTKAKLRHIQLTRDSVSSQGMLTYGAIRVLQALTTIFLLQHSAQLKRSSKHSNLLCLKLNVSPKEAKQASLPQLSFSESKEVTLIP